MFNYRLIITLLPGGIVCIGQIGAHMNIDDVRLMLLRGASLQPLGAAVLIPLIKTREGVQILLEVRAHDLGIQPGEVCLPGGHIEANETPREAAVRETCEELLVKPNQIELIGDMGFQPGPGGMPLHVFVGVLNGYEGTFSPDEVDHTFTLSLDWLKTHRPTIYDVRLTPEYPNDFPWHLIPGGRAYAWRAQTNHVPFYENTDPLVWGATARVLCRFAELCDESIKRG